VSDAVLILGVLAVAVGAGLVFMPAGLIVGGLLAIAGVIFYEKGTESDHEADRPGA
jgi:hypothetical protein